MNTQPPASAITHTTQVFQYAAPHDDARRPRSGAKTAVLFLIPGAAIVLASLGQVTHLFAPYFGYESADPPMLLMLSLALVCPPLIVLGFALTICWFDGTTVSRTVVSGLILTCDVASAGSLILLFMWLRANFAIA